MVFNPKDSNTFASASLDRTVKVWSIGQPTPNFTLEGHDKGVNCVDYFTGGACLCSLDAIGSDPPDPGAKAHACSANKHCLWSCMLQIHATKV